MADFLDIMHERRLGPGLIWQENVQSWYGRYEAEFTVIGASTVEFRFPPSSQYPEADTLVIDFSR